ncbi:cytochrome P450 [Nonomuraea sp. ATR24]|uniref:cytochrome P450 n=1 Tax=Nonomuraea sp. ATR24 TaxID=1676744 RepID=UPI0035C0FC6F
MLVTRHSEACSVLADSRYVPPPVRQGAPVGTLAWLRARVSRFSSGEEHARRRATLSAPLARLGPAALREAARALTAARRGEWRDVPTEVLGEALGFAEPGRLAEAVRAAAPGYLSGEESGAADAAVAELVKLAERAAGPEDERIALVTLLLQAHASVEGLIGNALAHEAPGVAVDDLLHETLRHDPPLKVTRRVDRESGDEVVIDLVAANRDPEVFASPERFDPARGEAPHLTFGAGLRPCPASRHALALAAGVLDAQVEIGEGR